MGFGTQLDEKQLGGAAALLFDLGGVVIDVDFDRVFSRWATLAECEPSLIKHRFAFDDAFRCHEKGRIDAAEFFDHLRSTLGIALTDDQFLDGWNSIFGEEMPGISQLLTIAAAQRPIYAFSNTNPSHVAYFMDRFAPVLASFKNIYLSSTIGLRKPDAEAFDFVVGAIGTPADQIVFFDDLIENVEAAKARRLRGVHVTASADIAAAFSTIGF